MSSLSEEDVRNLLRRKAGYRGVAKWCAKTGVSTSYASEFLKGQKPAGPLILDALGLEFIIRRKRNKRSCANSDVGAKKCGTDR